MLTYIKTAIRKPKEIYIGRNMKNSHFFSLALLITLVLTFLSLFQFVPAIRSVQSDFNEIKESIPAFELEDNQLTSPESSYIYQTDSMVFYFDPDNNITTDVIDDNMRVVSAPISVGILNNQIYVNFLNQSFSLVYGELNNFTTSNLQMIINGLGAAYNDSNLLTFFILFMAQLFSYSYQLILIALIASIANMLTKTRLRFFQILKMVLLANLMPTLLVNLVTAFITPVPFSFEIIATLTLIIFYISVNEMQKRIQNNKS